MVVQKLLPTLHKRVHPLASPAYQQRLLADLPLRQVAEAVLTAEPTPSAVRACSSSPSWPCGASTRRGDMTAWVRLVGNNLLVAPVLAPGQTARTLYLPTGLWRHYWTGDTYAGLGWVTVPAPLHFIPLFVRADAVLHLPTLASLTVQSQ